MKLALAFGPLRYDLTLPDEVPTLPWCGRYARSDGEPGRRVTVTLVETVPAASSDGFADDGFAALGCGDEFRVWVHRTRPWRWAAALCAIVAQQAPSEGCLVLHGCAVRVVGGVAVLVAPPRTGKTTFARNAGERSFAHNAVVIDGRGAARVWALPFAHDPHPELEASGSAALRCLAALVRGDEPSFEWLTPSAATVDIVRACARAPGSDILARERFVVALDLLTNTKVGRLTTTRGPRDLDPLDQRLSDGAPTNVTEHQVATIPRCRVAQRG